MVVSEIMLFLLVRPSPGLFFEDVKPQLRIEVLKVINLVYTTYIDINSPQIFYK